MQVGVSPNNTNVPVILKQRFDFTSLNLSLSYVLYFKSFQPSIPPSSTFNVPLICGSPNVGQQFMKNADHPSLIMPPFMMDPTGEVFKKMTELGKH